MRSRAAVQSELLGALDALANRGYTDGFYERHHTHEQQNYMRGHSESFRQQYVGDIVACANGMAEIDVKNRFSGWRQAGDHPSVRQQHHRADRDAQP